MVKKVLIAVALLGIFIYFIIGALPSSAAYVAEINTLRRAKNNSFRNSPESPIPKEQRAQFDSLKYYPLGSYWGVVTAQLQRFTHPDTVEIPMSDRKLERYIRFGRAEFTEADPVPGQLLHLTLFQRVGDNNSTLFVPFTDLSNGRGSYGGGRYLNVARPKADANEIELDFNQAYNPYCAYNNEYSCPVPPAENRLQIAITAGEKSFHD